MKRSRKKLNKKINDIAIKTKTNPNKLNSHVRRKTAKESRKDKDMSVILKERFQVVTLEQGDMRELREMLNQTCDEIRKYLLELDKQKLIFQIKSHHRC